MAISFIGSNDSASNNTTIPTHQEGDLIIIFCAAQEGSSISFTVPSGWTEIIGGSNYYPGANRYANGLVAYRFAPSSGTTTGNWSGARIITAMVYRGVSGIGSSATVSISDLTTSLVIPDLDITNNSSWVAGFSSADGNTDLNTSSPTNLTLREYRYRSSFPSFTTSVSYDTNGEVSSWSNSTLTTNSMFYISFAVELLGPAPIGFEHLDISNSGLVNKPSGSGFYLENSGAGFIRRSGTEGPGSLILDGSGRVITKGS